LLTDAYRNNDREPVQIQRALALDHILRKVETVICEDELIVGCKVPMAKGSPLYPEFNVRWLEDELDTMAHREETPFEVGEDTKRTVREQVIPEWQGRTVFDRIVSTAPHEALTGAEEGLFFHYYLDRSIGHITVNYEKVLKIGLKGLKEEIATCKTRLKSSTDDYFQKKTFYRALVIVANGIIALAQRYADLAAELSIRCEDQNRQKELKSISDICRRVPQEPAQSFHEALQSFWFIHLVLNLESNSYAISPGRFCQYIHPFYEADQKANRIGETAATPDGRFAGTPLSEGVSPVQGQDITGPTGVILSLAKVDHARTAGTLLNMKFAPAILEGREQLEKFAALIRTYFVLGGYHIQFNVVSKETLHAAQKDPDAFKSLIVRVAGYSDYFVTLSKDVQDEIIARTTHGID